ncbi:hypothetical protein FSP39_006766 [Pinctada imbricata]|uniref:Uncharacterized protein n=1 Tax=Pinctada imbricata TaxID=66713 RepID=A0AA89BW97_PINIB|nr:hypothetical protein FSP39_006766 [Pinctada imbricata]
MADAEQEAGPSVPKKLKRSTLEKFCEEFGSDSFELLKKHIFDLKKETMALGTFAIGSCNAADPDYGYCFTKAACSLRPTKVKVTFGSLFLEPFKALNELFCIKSLPKDGPVLMCVQKLMEFMLNKEMQKPLEDLNDCSDETELTVILATHLFSQLSISPSFTVNNRNHSQLKRCPCTSEKCPKTGWKGKIHYGDTSIGNSEVWHGFLDLVMDGAEVLIDTVDGEEDTVTYIDSTIEIKQKDFEMTDVSAGSRIAQVAAETIVYSFYYRSLHPESSHFLIPSIGVSGSEVLFYFYDSVNDVLLGSTTFKLMDFEDKLDITTVFAVWMVLNHKYLCNGLNELKLDQVPKSHFTEHAKSKLHVYREELKKGNLDFRHKKVWSVDPRTFTGTVLLGDKE